MHLEEENERNARLTGGPERANVCSLQFLIFVSSAPAPNPVTVAVCVSEILISSLTTVTTNQGLTTDNPFLDTFGCKDNNVDNNAVPYALRHECSPKAVGIASKTRLQLSPLRSLARKLEGGFPTCASFDEVENNCLFWF